MNKNEIKNKKNKLYLLGQHVVRTFCLTLLVSVITLILKQKMLAGIFGIVSLLLFITFIVIVTKINKYKGML